MKVLPDRSLLHQKRTSPINSINDCELVLGDDVLPKIIQKKESYIKIPSLSIYPELIHGFTTRFGGVSKDEYKTFNLNFNRNDDSKNVLRNFEILGNKLGVSLDNMVLSHQVHDKNLLRVEKYHGGMGIIKEREYHNIDGLITTESDLMLITYYADCVPLYFYDPSKKVIALVHSGWKGTLLNIGVEAIRKLKESFDCDPSNIVVAFGPHIKSCCFEVDYDVASIFFETFPNSKECIEKQNNKWHIDLERIIMYNLLNNGINPENILGCKICTKCHKSVFFSHRGSNGITGTGTAFLMIRR